MTFLKGVQHSRPDDDLEAMIAELNADWLNVLSFLTSMYGLQSRSTYRRAIIECVHGLWKREQGFREVLERHVRQSLDQDNGGPLDLPWIHDDEWRNVYAAEASALSHMEVASTELVRELAPPPISTGKMFHPSLGVATKCFRCGKRLGYCFSRKGFGWREGSHDARCLKRMLDGSRADLI